MIKLMDLIHEGIQDKGIFKAVFLAGGPGSGKTYVAKKNSNCRFSNPSLGPYFQRELS